MASRLETALAEGLFALPAEGATVALQPRAGTDLTPLNDSALEVFQTFRPDYEAFERKGLAVTTDLPDSAALTLVFLPKSRAYAEALIAHAARITTGPIVIDGQKTDGVESILKALRKRAEVTGVLSKAHGKLAVLAPGAAFDDWADPGPQPVAPGLLAPIGTFSADHPDPGSERLAAALPEKLGAHVADLGAGWGFLARAILTRATVETCTLIEAEKRALDAARRAITDPRARFEWADARSWGAPAQFDTIVTNPPFHTDRASDPALGQAFIDAAQRLLKPKGQLFLVANRHLPYERHLADRFGEAAEIGGDRSYKLLRAARPRKTGTRA
ncbi:methyltransferase [Ovoidimarina sediminis]|uniref:methyltransferase n=1 Tax=Ovoidimarina sediminis TaxID=3079856 RepID=UPI0029113B26|nr:methyltransferase [Rhodophyticola sp. MJ-SS7]MDU8944396.1 methyltransferase [Rhodophyticola sp. MJ-SS7]